MVSFGARAMGRALVFFALPLGIFAKGPAVLRLDAGKGKVHTFPALFAEWSSPKEKVIADPVVHSKANAFGCARHRRCVGCAIYVLQGNCTFAAKARHAEEAGAQLLIVSSAAEGPPTGMAASGKAHVFAPNGPSITAVMVSKTAGRKILTSIENREALTAECEAHDRFFADFVGEVFMAALAVGLVCLGAWHSVEDLRRPDEKAKFNEEVVAVEDHSGVHFVLFGSLMLTVLFFFMKYLIYILLLLFSSGAVSTTSMFLEPLIAARYPAMRSKTAFILPKRVASVTGFPEEHSWSDAISEFIGSGLAVAFLLFRNNDVFGWALQDIIAIMLLLTIQRTMRLPNLKTGTVLLVCTFFFDIFWVFLSPLIFKKSVMIEVATGGGTGQSVPMVLKIPGDIPGQFKILGLGDIAIPGLLISMLLRHDMVKGYRRFQGYFTAGVVGYALGLAATFLSLYLMKHGQPALLFLVPGTLLPTCFIAWRKGELQDLWSASYGPEYAPEGYEVLPDEAGKRA